MENYQKDQITSGDSNNPRERRSESRSGRMLAGLIVITVGALLLARQAGAYFPEWFFTWPMILIAVGLFIGAKHSFRGFGWVFPLAIGSVFLMEEIITDFSIRQYLWPVLLIFFGLFLIFRPRRRRRHRPWDGGNQSTDRSSEDFVDTVSIFGGTKKIVISKDFKGGDMTTIFGGTDLDLMQADFKGSVTLDVTQFFGGTKLIVPAHWNIKSDVVCVFGSVEDKRSAMKEASDPTKVLRLDGTCAFGGIEIKNY